MNPELEELIRASEESDLMNMALNNPIFGVGMQMPSPPTTIPQVPRQPMQRPQTAIPQASRQPMQRPPVDMRQLMTIPYIVKKGDNLTKIARSMGIPVSEVIKANPELKNPQRIFPGQELRVPMRGEMGSMNSLDMPNFEFGGMQVAPELTQQTNRPAYWQERDAMSPEQRMQRDMMMGGAAGLGAIGAAAAAPLAGAVGAAPVAALGGLARLMPRQLPPAGRPAFPMSKGAVDWPGAAKTWSNVRPLNIPIGAQRTMGVEARNALARAREAQEFGRAEPTRQQLDRMMRILKPDNRTAPPMSTLDELLSRLGG